MLSDWKHAVIHFITSDVKSESETKELAVLIRILCSIFGIYYLILSVIIASQSFYMLSLILIFAVGVLAGTFICTYENKTTLALKSLCVVLVIISAFLSLKVGFGASYHWLSFVTVFLVFYDYSCSLRDKFCYAVFLCAFTVAVTLLANFFPVLKGPVTEAYYSIVILNIIVLLLSMTATAYFYCSKFTDSEAKIIQYNKKLLQMASLDALTQLPNRRTMNEHMQELVNISSRSGEPFCIAIGDIDFFKHVNDQYGHETGDYVLCTVASFFQNFMKDKGMVARWGGEEFLFTFERVHIGQSLYELRTLSEMISNYDFHFKDQHFQITMTFGLESYRDYIGIEGTISKADDKLYYGKEHGRNQVVDWLPDEFA